MGIYWYEFRPGLKDTVEWIRHIVDYGGRAGGGLQMVVVDIDNDGDRDIVTPAARSKARTADCGPRTI